MFWGLLMVTVVFGNGVCDDLNQIYCHPTVVLQDWHLGWGISAFPNISAYRWGWPCAPTWSCRRQGFVYLVWMPLPDWIVPTCVLHIEFSATWLLSPCQRVPAQEHWFKDHFWNWPNKVCGDGLACWGAHQTLQQEGGIAPTLSGLDSLPTCCCWWRVWWAFARHQ